MHAPPPFALFGFYPKAQYGAAEKMLRWISNKKHRKHSAASLCRILEFDLKFDLF